MRCWQRTKSRDGSTVAYCPLSTSLVNVHRTHSSRPTISRTAVSHKRFTTSWHSTAQPRFVFAHCTTTVFFAIGGVEETDIIPLIKSINQSLDHSKSPPCTVSTYSKSLPSWFCVGWPRLSKGSSVLHVICLWSSSWICWCRSLLMDPRETSRSIFLLLSSRVIQARRIKDGRNRAPGSTCPQFWPVHQQPKYGSIVYLIALHCYKFSNLRLRNLHLLLLGHIVLLGWSKITAIVSHQRLHGRLMIDWR